MPTRVPFTVLLIILLFSNRHSPGSLKFLWSLQFSTGSSPPGRLEKYSTSWKKDVSINTQNALVRHTPHPLLGTHTSPPLISLQPPFPSLLTYFSLPLVLLSFLFIFLYSFSLSIVLPFTLMARVLFFTPLFLFYS